MISTNAFAWCDRAGLAELLVRPEVGEALHVCATESFRRALTAVHGREAPFAISIGRLTDELCSPWYSARTQLRQFVRLRSLINAVPLPSGVSEDQRAALLRTRHELLKGFRASVEAGLSPASIVASNPLQELALRVWEGLEAAEPRFALPRTRLYAELTNGTSAQSALSRAIPTVLRHEESLPSSFRRIILHGFYFITPPQLQVMRILRIAGCELEFCNFRDRRADAVSRSWDAFFRSEFGLPERNAWTFVKPQASLLPAAEVFARAYEGKDETREAEGVRLECYESAGALGRALSACYFNEGTLPPVIVSAEDAELETRLREFLPGTVEPRRHLLSHPFGRFLANLHKVYSGTEDVALDAVSLVEIASSGWMKTGGKDARTLLGTVDKVLPYFFGCHRLDEWLERTDRLRKAHEVLVAPFRANAAPAAIAQIDSPFERFSFLAVTREELVQFEALLKDIAAIANRLFIGQQVGLKGHLEKLLSLANEQADDALLSAAERLVLDDLRDALADAEADDLSIDREDLSDALAVLLGRHEEESADPPPGAVQRFSHLDGTALTFGAREIHLAFCDELLVPHRPSSVPLWPFQIEDIQQTTEAWRIGRALLDARRQTAIDADLHLLFLTLALAERVVFSWAKRRAGAEDLAMSPLLRPLSTQVRAPKPVAVQFSPPAKPAEMPRQAVSAGELPAPLRMTWAICERRFFYETLLPAGAASDSDFHHGFFFGTLARGLSRHMAISISEVKAHLAPFFPHWPAARIASAVEDAGSFRSTGVDEFERRSYPRFLRRLVLHHTKSAAARHPVQRAANAGSAQIAEQVDAALRQVNEPLPPGNPGPHCHWCTHENRCTSARRLTNDS